MTDTSRQTYRQTGMGTYRQTYRQTGRQTDSPLNGLPGPDIELSVEDSLVTVLTKRSGTTLVNILIVN